MSDPSAAIPAATLVIFRPAPGEAPPELLLVERSSAMRFAAGALVFPGGRVDPGDLALADRLIGTVSSERDEVAARIAAIRETIEEAGLAIGVDPLPSPDQVADLRRRLVDGDAIGTALDAAGLRLDLDRLTPFARWRPAHRTTRIFDTRFYLAALPEGAGPASVDATENVRLFWAAAAAVLAQVDAGRASVIFPTRRNLERLARFASLDAATADARAHPIETVVPWIELRDGVSYLCIPDHLGYPIVAEPLDTAVRG